MTKNRLEAFSDGVIAIIITIMVLELHPPHEPTIEAVLPLVPIFLSYVLSFVFLGIYWNNHHHLFQAVKHVNGNVLWANLHLLFWLSLIPFVTSWLGETNFDTIPVAIYGTVLLLAAVAYTILANLLISIHGSDSVLGKAFENNLKGNLSLVSYGAAIPLAFVHPLISCALYVFVAILWLIPDQRIERNLER